MTTTIRAKVMRIPKTKGLWLTFAAARNDNGLILINQADQLMAREHYAHSHPEAIQAAQVLLRDLDAELMAEVHTSRATRREQPKPECTCALTPAYYPKNSHGNHYYGCPLAPTDPHTMEATA